MNVGHTDTDDTTALHVPDLGLVVAGDSVYNGVHQYLAESDSQGRKDWLAALDIIEALGPRAVVAGHKRYGNDDNPRTIEETRQYIRDFDRLDQETSTAPWPVSAVPASTLSTPGPGTPMICASWSRPAAGPPIQCGSGRRTRHTSRPR